MPCWSLVPQGGETHSSVQSGFPWESPERERPAYLCLWCGEVERAQFMILAETVLTLIPLACNPTSRVGRHLIYESNYFTGREMEGGSVGIDVQLQHIEREALKSQRCVCVCVGCFFFGWSSCSKHSCACKSVGFLRRFPCVTQVC